jgi:hypothetical protein
MSNLEKISIGALGGLSAVLVKFLGQDYATVVAQAANLSADQVLAYQVGYGLLTPILMFLGALVAWVSEERKRIKLMALAIAAPAMITTWSGGQKEAPGGSAAISIISNAVAQRRDADGMQPARPDVVTEKNLGGRVRDGVAAFFGYGKAPARYWVVVGAFANRAAAQQHADRINQRNPELAARVAAWTSIDGAVPVIVGHYSLLSDAQALRAQALATGIIQEARLYRTPGQ